MPEQLLFTEEAAAFLNISVRLLHRYLYELPEDRRLIPDEVKSGRLLFKKKTLRNFERRGPGRPPQKGHTHESEPTRARAHETTSEAG